MKFVIRACDINLISQFREKFSSAAYLSILKFIIHKFSHG